MRLPHQLLVLRAGVVLQQKQNWLIVDFSHRVEVSVRAGVDNSCRHQLLIGGDQETTLTTAHTQSQVLCQLCPPVDELVGLGAVASKESEAAKCFSSPL